LNPGATDNVMGIEGFNGGTVAPEFDIRDMVDFGAMEIRDIEDWPFVGMET
jgi:hypothetical protein